MDHEPKVEVDAGYWLTAPHICERCRTESLVTILVVTKGVEWWGGIDSPITEPSFVIDVDCDLPLEFVKQRWDVNPNLGMPTEGERTFNSLTNICQRCGAYNDDIRLVEVEGPFLQRKAAAVARITLAPLEQLPLTIDGAQVADGDGLRGLIRRVKHGG